MPTIEPKEKIIVKEEGKKSMELDKEIKIEEEKIEEEKPEEEKVEEKPFKSFQTQEELDAYIEGQAKEETKEEELPKREPVKLYEGSVDPKTGKWVGEAPKDWNEFANKILEAATPQVAETIRGMGEEEKKELADINAGFDKEYNELARQNKVPALNTKEGQEVNKQISLIGVTYGQASITKSHELWSKMPKAQGGGLDYEAKGKITVQKQKAGLVGSSKGTPSKQKTPQRSYGKLHNTPTDDLIEQRLEQ